MPSLSVYGRTGGVMTRVPSRRLRATVCSVLHTLAVCECGLGVLGAEALAAGLAANTTLACLDVSCNSIGSVRVVVVVVGIPRRSWGAPWTALARCTTGWS